MDTSYPKEEDISPPVDNTKYRQAIGALLYIATVTRPDITLAVNRLSRKNESPNEKDWKAVLRVIEYLNSTKDICLRIDFDSTPTLSCYTDADYASDLTTRRSTGGNLFFLGNNPIFWSTKRQNCVSLSSTESELISAATAAQELKWILDHLKDFGITQKLPIKIFERRVEAVFVAKGLDKYVDVEAEKRKLLKQRCKKGLRIAATLLDDAQLATMSSESRM
ncbi:secreted RxLR effector protein 161-like [Stegodyphus dumicola]|uniref:secreted RxLR effector protein 161-like n=1 Tax=Stegodyphus dumicola TaxID=202533 RepID=UPI0015AB993B|nr:secreted RxLR effector protein 161-like [Stegodyphus dumicola]